MRISKNRFEAERSPVSWKRQLIATNETTAPRFLGLQVTDFQSNRGLSTRARPIFTPSNERETRT